MHSTVRCTGYCTSVLNSVPVAGVGRGKIVEKLGHRTQVSEVPGETVILIFWKHTLDKWECHMGVGKLDVMVTKVGG